MNNQDQSPGAKAQQIAEIANTINNNLHTVFKNNDRMVTKLAIAVFVSHNAASVERTKALTELENMAGGAEP